MKTGIHPTYRPVLFEDVTVGERWLTSSTVATTRTAEFEGSTYPLYSVEVSNLTHPYYTGQMKIIDTAGRVDRFNRRYGARRSVK